MEINKKIKLRFKNEEKILVNIPGTFEELKKQFHTLFIQSKPELDYLFEYHLTETVFINKVNYEDEIENIKVMDDPIIYIEEPEAFNHRSIAISNYNNNINNSINNNSNIFNTNISGLNRTLDNTQIINSQVINSINLNQEENNNTLEYKQIIEKLEKELENTKEELEKEINNTDELRTKIEKLVGFDDKNGKEELINNIAKLEKDKKEIIEKNKILIKERNEIKDENIRLSEELNKKKKEFKELKDIISELKEKINVFNINEEKKISFRNLIKI